MPDALPDDLSAFVEDFRQALEDCENLYRSCALECARTHPDLANGSASRDFVHRMLDLYRGLALKLFVEVAYVERRWSGEVLVLAGELFEQIWHKRLNEKQILESLDHYLTQSSLSWDVLLGPYDRISTFRGRVPQVQTLVMRIANLVAKVDGRVSAKEVRQLQWIQKEVRRVVERIPLVSTESETGAVKGSQLHQCASFELVAPKSVGEGMGVGEGRAQQAVMIETASPEQMLAEAFAELDILIGLSTIKQDVRGLVNFLKIQKAREKFDLPRTSISLHTTFSGNPGTGKTTVARLLGRFFTGMGLLRRGHLIETDRSGLVAEYAGQTAPKSHKKIDEALDGVLFIDEAYSLVAEKGDDPYGTEALQVLLKRMEDNRDRLVVVLAGYPEPLDRLIQSNPGLASRFSRNFHFPDYSAAELGRIFEALCKKNRYEVPILTRVKLLLGFDHLLLCRDEHFGNGRLVRNVFEQAISRLANRIASIVPLTRELLTTLAAEDIVLDDVPVSVWDDLACKTRPFRTACPGCKHESRFPQEFLMQTVQCKECHENFHLDWANVDQG